MRAHTGKTRAARIRELAARLEKGEDVQARDLKIVLTAEQYDEYQRRWQEQLDHRNAKKPTDVSQYESLLQEALLAYAKFDRYSGKGSSRSNLIVNRSQRAEVLQNTADRLFKEALEFLIDSVSRDPSIAAWFDRRLDFRPDSDLSIDPVGMPRVITSRSADNLSSRKASFGLKSKRELKLEILREALEPLASKAMDGEVKEKGERLRAMAGRFGRDL